jgi:hypothetical protein
VQSPQEELGSSAWEERVWAESAPEDKAGTEGPQRKDASVGGGMDGGLKDEMLSVEKNQTNEGVQTGGPGTGQRALN